VAYENLGEAHRPRGREVGLSGPCSSRNVTARRSPRACASWRRKIATCAMNEAEKKAAALPPKLTVPMILFFLPVLFVVILGPTYIKVAAMQ